jgi:hypothetical protein
MTKQSKITKKRIEELQGAVDRLKEEEADLKIRLSGAELDLWNARNEIKRNAKPSPAMLSVLRMMAAGEPLHRNRYSYSFYIHNPEGRSTKIREPVFSGLIDREAITGFGDEWRINDHGRAILERWTTKTREAA